jgi:hypothetical protein
MTSAHAGERPGGLRDLPVLRQIIDVWLKFHHSRPVTVFRRWRHGRPFWAGVFTALSAAELMYIPSAKLTLVIHEGIAGVSAYLMGILLIVMAVTMWFAPNYRVFAGIATTLFAVASLILSNLGGFLLGMLLGIIGGALAVAWTPLASAPPATEPTPEAAAPEPEAATAGTTTMTDGEDTAVTEPINDDGSWQRADLA